jgi:hypothetical protein
MGAITGSKKRFFVLVRGKTSGALRINYYLGEKNGTATGLKGFVPLFPQTEFRGSDRQITIVRSLVCLFVCVPLCLCVFVCPCEKNGTAAGLKGFVPLFPQTEFRGSDRQITIVRSLVCLFVCVPLCLCVFVCPCEKNGTATGLKGFVPLFLQTEFRGSDRQITIVRSLVCLLVCVPLFLCVCVFVCSLARRRERRWGLRALYLCFHRWSFEAVTGKSPSCV